MFTWNSRDLMNNNYLLFTGVAYFFVAVIDLLHTLSYSGMGIFPGYDADLPTQLWITARLIQSLSLIFAAFFFRKRLNPFLLKWIFIAVTGILIAAIFSGNFPSCYIAGKGLTAFKITMEYIISTFFLISGVLLFFNKKEFEKDVYYLIMGSIGLTVVSELFFTFYVDVHDISNLAGHLIKVIAFYLIYKAIIETGFKRPYDLLFRDLSRREGELREAVSNVKTLTGLLPICASCKKIRDDKGYWKMIESYISEHSDAEFTHGICPDCVKKLYPQLDEYYNSEKGKA